MLFLLVEQPVLLQRVVVFPQLLICLWVRVGHGTVVILVTDTFDPIKVA